MRVFYQYHCIQCDYDFDVRLPAPESVWMCPLCENLTGVRVYTAPILHIPEMNAIDVLNRHTRGEGDPLPGYTQAQTKRMALAKAQIEKQGRRGGTQLDRNNHPLKSVGSRPARPDYGD